MLVNVLNICSDDELMSDGDDALEEGMIRRQLILFKISLRIQLNIAIIKIQHRTLRKYVLI